MLAQAQVLAHHPAVELELAAGETALPGVAQALAPRADRTRLRDQAVEAAGQRTPLQIDAVEGHRGGRRMRLAGQAAQRRRRRGHARRLLYRASRLQQRRIHRRRILAQLGIELRERRIHARGRGQRGSSDAAEIRRRGGDAERLHGDRRAAAVVGQRRGQEHVRRRGHRGERAAQSAAGFEHLVGGVVDHVVALAEHVQRAALQRRGAGHRELVADQQRQPAVAGLHVVAAQAQCRGADLEGAGIADVAAQRPSADEGGAVADRHIGAQAGRAERAGLHLGIAAVAVLSAAQGQGAAALLDQAAATGDVVGPGGAAAEGHADVAPVEPGRPQHRLADIEQAIAEGGIHPGRAQVGGGAEQGLPQQIVAEVGKRLPHQRRGAGDQRRRVRRAAAVVIARVGGGRLGIDEHFRARRDQAVVHGHAAGVGIRLQLAAGARIHRGHHQPAAFQVSRRMAAAGAGLAGQRGDVRRIGLGFVADGEDHQPAMAQHERTVFGGDRIGRGRIGPVDAAPGIVHHLDPGVDQVLVH